MKRVEWIDILKGIGIFLIVWGHCGIGHFAFSWFYHVHVPIFYIISGILLSCKGYNISFMEQVKHSAKNLLFPYIGFSICNVLFGYTRYVSLNTGFSLIGYFRSFILLDFGVL